MDQGYIKLWRKLLNSAIWNTTHVAQKAFAIDCLALANYKQGKIDVGGKEQVILPGQFWTSLDSLKKKTGLTVQQIRTCLTRLTTLEFLTYKTTSHGTLVSITNWDTYQNGQAGTNKPSNKRVTSDQQAGNNKQEGKKDKNKEYTPSFLEFWGMYPKAARGRSEKLTAFEKWNTRLGEGVKPEDMIEAARRYAKTNPDREYTKGAQVFIGRNRPFEGYLVDEPEKKSHYAAVEAKQEQKAKEREGREMVKLTPEMRKELFGDGK